MIELNAIQSHIDKLVKPQGSLGQWESLAVRLCTIQQSIHPIVRPAELVVFAADHGVVLSGVSLWPPMITTVMVEQIARGTSASAVLASQYEVDYRVVDVGCITPPRLTHPRLSSRRIAAGTRNLIAEPAMSLHEFRQAMEIGADEARMTLLRGAKVTIAGDMGIGNTTSSSCLAVLLADVPLNQAVGNGAGANERSLKIKQEAVQTATNHVLERCGRTVDEAGMAAVCGLEIAAIAGFYLQCAKQKQTILLDGMIATAGALIAQQYDPSVVDHMIAAHQSDEPAHALMLERLWLKPMLHWNMRLGEGTGALALYPLLIGAAAWVTQMAKLDELG